MVDAGEHQIRRLLQQAKQGQLDAIRRRAAAGPGRHPRGEEFIRPLRPDGGLQGEAMARGRAFLVRADDGDPVSSGAGLRGQTLNAIREDAVIVADEDAQRARARGAG